MDSDPTPTIREQKRALRQHYLALRRAMPHEEWRAKSDAIAEQVLALPEVQHANTILTYVSSKDNEVDTIRIIETLLSRGRQVAAPLVTGPGLMEWRLITSLQDLAPGNFGVLEPIVENTDQYEHFRKEDVCLVPGIVWDERGYRIGYGMGFYDRHLQDFAGQSIGLLFSSQLAQLPTEEHDVAAQSLVAA